ncbi:hypothetical protein ACFYUR_22035 [Micromonospora haikouensis]|uniref:hypothetical protein n=1 Tax=Micromonospora haikouensis TaxID=686309 RepID=UPI0036B1354E
MIHLPALGPDLPVHPFTGLTAIGLRRNGQPIWPVKGGAPGDDDSGDGDEDSGTDDSDDQGDAGDDADDLRDAGKKALDAMKGQRNKARADLRPWTALARDLGVKTPDEVKALLAGKTKDGGDAPDPEQIRREARAEAQRETLNERVLDKIEAKARKFADPADAAALLLREHGVDDFLDGSRIDADAIAEALDDLLERKPYLAAAAPPPPRTGPKPDPSQGSRGGAKPSSAERAAKRLERLGVRKPSS